MLINISQSILIIVPSDFYYFNLVRNFYISNIVKYNLSNIFIVAAYTNKMYMKCKEYKIPVSKIDNQISEDNISNKITTEYFVKKTRLKHPIIYKYLKKYNILLFLDADVYFLVNPLTLLYYFNIKSDLMMPCDDLQCNLLNYGYLLIRKSKKTLKYIKELIDIESNCKSYKWNNAEQGIANRYIKKISYLTIQKMKINIFMDGFNFFKYCSFNIDSRLSQLIGFHNDFTIGIESKEYRLKELGFYKIDNEIKYIKKYRYLYYNGSTSLNINETIRILSFLLYLSKCLNRTLILPQFDCKMKRKCSFVELFNIECFNRCNYNYKENISFLFLFNIVT